MLITTKIKEHKNILIKHGKHSKTTHTKKKTHLFYFIK